MATASWSGWFQSTRPARGATGPRPHPGAIQRVSIHAPRTGRDGTLWVQLPLQEVSIHAPRTGRDLPRVPLRLSRHVSIHAPRTGRDLRALLLDAYTGLFQSTRPARGATFSRVIVTEKYPVSIHAPRTGRDLRAVIVECKVLEFQSTRPARGATRGPVGGEPVRSGFNPRAPHGARPGSEVNQIQFEGVSIHAPRTGRDVMCFHTVTPFGCFNPRAPHGARPEATA